MSDQERQELQDQVSVIRSSVPGVLEISLGKNITEGRNNGYTYGLRALFADRETIKVYAEHEEHVKLVKMLRAASLPNATPVCLDWEL